MHTTGKTFPVQKKVNVKMGTKRKVSNNKNPVKSPKIMRKQKGKSEVVLLDRSLLIEDPTPRKTKATKMAKCPIKKRSKIVSESKSKVKKTDTKVSKVGRKKPHKIKTISASTAEKRKIRPKTSECQEKALKLRDKSKLPKSKATRGREKHRKPRTSPIPKSKICEKDQASTSGYSSSHISRHEISFSPAPLEDRVNSWLQEKFLRS